MSKIRVEIVESEIVVIDPRTEWSVSYRHVPALKGLRATQVTTDRKAKVSERSRFMAEAFRLASHRARKLGWKV